MFDMMHWLAPDLISEFANTAVSQAKVNQTEVFVYRRECSLCHARRLSLDHLTGTWTRCRRGSGGMVCITGYVGPNDQSLEQPGGANANSLARAERGDDKIGAGHLFASTLHAFRISFGQQLAKPGLW
ncbi:hypothetical protein ElyMa_002351300 [Elysia marginata]|uniref:Uncharacterized protein n=1 Tax=Elysia marginata TaxID=1093978 RepID=A0AAV4G838_9GAST|nr:hypothetical protein ElyMa_002351300 [Elysia marginata]